MSEGGGGNTKKILTKLCKTKQIIIIINPEKQNKKISPRVEFHSHPLGFECVSLHRLFGSFYINYTALKICIPRTLVEQMIPSLPARMLVPCTELFIIELVLHRIEAERGEQMKFSKKGGVLRKRQRTKIGERS